MAYLGTVTRITDGSVYVELPAVAPGFEFGPVVDTVGGLVVGDDVVTTSLDDDPDNLVVTGRIGGITIPEPEPLAPYPIGAVYISAVATSPATLFGGTWAALPDRMLIGVGSNPRWDAALETGGSETVTLTAAQSGLPAHSHSFPDTGYSSNFADSSGSGFVYGFPMKDVYNDANPSASNANTASDAAEPHDNMPPFIAAYMWRRTG